LSKVPPVGKNAIRDALGAVENVFRIVCPKAPRLVAPELRKHLEPTVQKMYANDSVAQAAASKALSSLSDWVDSAHFYRHEPRTPEPQEPPLEIAVLLVSGAASWLRWLAGFH
jgi:hypothetical protein